MVDSTRALLDELMGKDRNAMPAQRSNRDIHFSDPEICKFYICGFCPNDLFTNTKSDLGPCTKLHDDHCKQMFQESPKRNTYPYERDHVRFLERLIDDLDRRIKKGHDRLDVQDDKAEIPLTVENAEKVRAISEKIQTLLAQIEDLGEEGKVDESQQLMKVVDRLKTEKEQIIQGNDNRPLSANEKRMKVCEICGAFLVVGDTEKRMLSHLDGKQHQGFALIRKTVADYKITHTDEDFRDDKDRKGRDNRDNRDNRDREREKERDRERERDRDRYRHSTGERKKRDRSRERDSRDKKRSRDSY